MYNPKFQRCNHCSLPLLNSPVDSPPSSWESRLWCLLARLVESSLQGRIREREIAARLWPQSSSLYPSFWSLHYIDLRPHEIIRVSDSIVGTGRGKGKRMRRNPWTTERPSHSFNEPECFRTVCLVWRRQISMACLPSFTKWWWDQQTQSQCTRVLSACSLEDLESQELGN